LDGIIAYQREHELWSIYLGEQQRGARPPQWMKSWKGDGIIARIETEEIAAVVRRSGLPTVDVSAARLIPDLPWVETEDITIARMAARHLMDRGFRTLAYCGEPVFNWSSWREHHFVEFARHDGCECHVYRGKASIEKGYSWTRERARMSAWVQGLPKPAGVMTCYDIKGQQLLDMCRDLDIAVPEQVAVIGVDNDVRLCRLCTPTLTSVIPDTRRAGYEAAQLLDRMMLGEKVDAQGILIPPTGIANRRSSDVNAIQDKDVVTAMRFIREHACDGITVADVLRVVPLSRRMLEYRFHKLVGRSPHAEIVRIRIERTSQLLRETTLSLAQIANRTGFSHANYLSVAFKKQSGMSPLAYRKKA
jgi:LacI family transcriptional regulator